MVSLTHRIIYFLMITLVINAGGWTFNQEAVADVWFAEQRNMALDIDHSPTESDGAQAVSPKTPCNHWCHAVGHFIGLFSHWALITHEFANGYSAQQSLTILLSSPDGRFRPPRFLSYI
jgi:hypothetical protein